MATPLRTLRNKLSEQFTEIEIAGVPKEVLEMFDRERMYLGLIMGDIDGGSLLAGRIVGLIKDIKPVRTIIEEIVSQAEEVIDPLKRIG